MSVYRNIHRVASRLIPQESIKYRKGLQIAVSDAGIPTATYGAWTAMLAHVQPGIISSFGGKNVSEKEYHDFGLDFSKRYFTIWFDDVDIKTNAKQNVPDQVQIYGSVFNVIHVSDWLEYNGWKRCYCEEVIEP